MHLATDASIRLALLSATTLVVPQPRCFVCGTTFSWHQPCWASGDTSRAAMPPAATRVPMTPAAIAAANKRMKKLRQRDVDRQAKRQAQLQEWFEEFDINKDNTLQRDELRALLTHLHPQAPPTEENLDFLIERSTRVESSTLSIKGNKNGAVPWADAMSTVLRWTDYVREQAFIDSIFTEFDDDQSGTLDPSELTGLLQKCAPEGYVVVQTDVDYVVSLCDANRNDLIDREEVKPMIARWKQLSAERWEEQQHVDEEKNTSPLSRMLSGRSMSGKSAQSLTSAAAAFGSPSAKASLRLAGNLAAARHRAAVAEGGAPPADGAPAASPAAAESSVKRSSTLNRMMSGKRIHPAPPAAAPPAASTQARAASTDAGPAPSKPAARDASPPGRSILRSLFCCASPPANVSPTSPPNTAKGPAKKLFENQDTTVVEEFAGSPSPAMTSGRSGPQVTKLSMRR